MFYVTVVVKSMLKERRLWSQRLVDVNPAHLNSHDREIYDFMMAVVGWEELDDIQDVSAARLVLDSIAKK